MHATRMMTARDYWLSMSETEWEDYVLAFARARGWLRHAERPARRRSNGEDNWRTPIKGDRGWPDLALVHPSGRFLIVELKSETGRRSPDQRRWGDALVAAGIDYRVWRPRDRQEMLDTLECRR